MSKKLTLSNVLIVVSFFICLFFAISFYSLSTLGVCISAMFGILASRFAKDGRWYAFIFDILSSALYLSSCLNSKFYGEFILSVLIILFNFICLKEWKKHSTNNIVKVNDVSGSEIRFIFFVGVMALTIYTIFLSCVNSNFALFNAICTISFILGNYFSFRRSVFQFYCLIMYEIFFITLWCISAFSGNVISILFVFGGLFEFSYDIMGIIRWNKISNIQKSKKCKAMFFLQ